MDNALLVYGKIKKTKKKQSKVADLDWYRYVGGMLFISELPGCQWHCKLQSLARLLQKVYKSTIDALNLGNFGVAHLSASNSAFIDGFALYFPMIQIGCPVGISAHIQAVLFFPEFWFRLCLQPVQQSAETLVTWWSLLCVASVTQKCYYNLGTQKSFNYCW